MLNEDWLPLSYISQYGYCPRRAALLMNQQLWTENEYTAEGRFQHRRAHEHRIEHRGAVILMYEFPVYSQELHLSGKCDCIEAHADPNGTWLPGENDAYHLYPVEYKHGPVRHETEYEQQLCAQALCLEEMYHTEVKQGALFYIQSHQRLEIQFTTQLRENTTATVQSLWKIWQDQCLPQAEYGPRCKKCSMQENCMPKLTQTAAGYRRKLLQELKRVDEK